MVFVDGKRLHHYGLLASIGGARCATRGAVTVCRSCSAGSARLSEGSSYLMSWSVLALAEAGIARTRLELPNHARLAGGISIAADEDG